MNRYHLHYGLLKKLILNTTDEKQQLFESLQRAVIPSIDFSPPRRIEMTDKE
jgi:hypothetical protein